MRAASPGRCWQQVKVALLKFLQDASDFYRRLAVKLQATFGDVGVAIDAQGQISSENAPSQQQPAGAVNARVSVYRCLICLGDLARHVPRDSDSDI